MIRAATHADADAIAAIWNPVIRDTVITFNPVEKTPAMICDMLDERAALGQGVFVAEGAGGVVGFALYGQFRGGVGYAHTAEHTIVLGPDARGLGLGKALMTAIEDHARAAGIHTLWAGVSSGNMDGVRFHAHMGFTEIATLPQVGRKFDQWLDLVLMQKRL